MITHYIYFRFIRHRHRLRRDRVVLGGGGCSGSEKVQEGD